MEQSIEKESTEKPHNLQDEELESFVQKKTLENRSPPPLEILIEKLPNINAQESIAATMEIDWDTRKIRRPMRVISIADSAIVLGSYNKGRLFIVITCSPNVNHQDILHF